MVFKIRFCKCIQIIGEQDKVTEIELIFSKLAFKELGARKSKFDWLDFINKVPKRFCEL